MQAWIIPLCITGGLSLFVAALAIGGLRWFVSSKKKEINAAYGNLIDKEADVSLYIYDPKINSFDDIYAGHITKYRDSGIVTRIFDDAQIFHQKFSPTKDYLRDMQLIIAFATEVKRVDEKTVLYFFKKLGPIKIKSLRAKMIYNSLFTPVSKGNAAVLKMEETDSEN